MIHYHGTPMSGKREEVARFLAGRHSLIPYPNPEDMAAAAAVSASFVLDNGAFTVWKQGGEMDVQGYVSFVEQWCRHPSFDWALIPDVIEGTEADNDELLSSWPQDITGVPVWHFHESLERLTYLCTTWDTVALGSSGEWPTPGTDRWWTRVGEAMAVACNKDGQPLCRLHGLRMLSPAIFTKLPLKSADSTNVAQNSGSLTRFGIYLPPTRSQRAEIIADRIESHGSAPVWDPVWAKEDQLALW